MSNQLFAMLANARNSRNRQNQTWTNQERARLNMVRFGEEEPNYEERFGEANALGRTRMTLPFEHIRQLTAQITSQMFNGSSRYEEEVRRWYVALTNARARQDKSSLRGHNVKGVVAAILYLHIRMVENKAPSVQTIIDAANRVRSDHVYSLNRHTFEKSKQMVLDYLRSEFRYSKDAIGYIEDHIDKIGIELGLVFNERMEIKEMLLHLPPEYLSGTNPLSYTVARVLIFIVLSSSNPDLQLEKDLKISNTDKTKRKPLFSKELKPFL